MGDAHHDKARRRGWEDKVKQGDRERGIARNLNPLVTGAEIDWARVIIKKRERERERNPDASERRQLPSSSISTKEGHR